MAELAVAIAAAFVLGWVVESRKDRKYRQIGWPAARERERKVEPVRPARPKTHGGQLGCDPPTV